ncbi:MAG: efflux RND transporter periplasmic adaptor subunit [Gemmatimonadota bacterium]
MPSSRTAVCLLAVFAVVSCSREAEQTFTVQTVPVTRQNIVVDATASGAVEPINVIEVKSKAGGQIVRLPVETGSNVRSGDLLVQIETRDVQNQFDQARADLNAAEAKLQVSEAQKKRSDDLFAQRIITAQENETAQIDYANSQAAVIRARTSLDLAQQRLDDATVRAPGPGTVIEKTVSLGQVITSATSSASGGSILLKMADLSRVRMRALFNETDIGSVQPGQQATVRVDAYPDRPFRGNVEKIEPQAVIQQSVTMFPVLIYLDNEAGMLKPGMNGEASVLVEERENVVAVPNDAIRTAREAPLLAGALGLSGDSVQAQIQAQMASAMGGMGRMGGGGFGGSGNGGGRQGGGAGGARSMQGEVDLAQQAGGGGARGGGQRPEMPQASEQQCSAVRDAMARKPEVAQQIAGLRQRVMDGQLDFAGMRTESERLYRELGVDPMVARACQPRTGGGPGGTGGQGGRQGTGGGNPGAAAGGDNQARAAATGAVQRGAGGRAARPAGNQGGPTPVQGGEFPTRTRTRTGVVFVQENGAFAARVVRLGLGNFDYTEVIDGLKEGDQVALLAAAQMQANRDSSNARMRQNMGGGVPGAAPAGPGGGPGGGGGPRRP